MGTPPGDVVEVAVCGFTGRAGWAFALLAGGTYRYGSGSGTHLPGPGELGTHTCGSSSLAAGCAGVAGGAGGA
jgi:hypothetical protein